MLRLGHRTTHFASVCYPAVFPTAYAATLHGSGWNLVVRDNNAADYDAIRAQLGSGWLPTLESFLRAFWTMMTRDWGVARHPQL